MPPDFLSVAEKMSDDRIAPQRASMWPVLALLAVLGLLYVAWFLERFDEATQPVPVPQGVAGAGYQYGEP